MTEIKIKIIQGDCLEHLKTLPDNSIDAVVTDPPAGISFMGKSWDTFDSKMFGKKGEEGDNDLKVKKNFEILPRYANSDLIGFQNFICDVFTEVYRVLKPGGHGLVWSIPRTSHHTAMGLERAGFEIRDVIAHVFGSGFPKSLNIGKSLDKRRVKNFDGIRKFLREEIKKSGLTHNQLLERLGLSPGSGLITHWTTENKESYQILPSPSQWQNLKKILNLSDDFDSEVLSYEREVIGTKKTLALPISQELPNWGETKEYKITIPYTDEAKEWEGWGTALKPAREDWWLIRKPIEKGLSIAENCLKWGVGGINIDECRIQTDEKVGARARTETESGNTNMLGCNANTDFKGTSVTGRFPANLILTHNEDEYILKSELTKQDKEKVFKWLYENSQREMPSVSETTIQET